MRWILHNDPSEKVWFAMNAPFRKELDAKQLLDEKAIENFVPMQYKIVTRRGGKKSRELVPAISNLLFARTTRAIIQEIKKGVQFLQYRTCPENGRNVPIIVPDVQMRQFISISETFNENLVYLKPEEINLKKGARVRVIGGAFDGVEGIFMKVRGARSKRVVVLIEGVTAVVMAEISADLIEIL
jgi:transcription antitermination factor NusG